MPLSQIQTINNQVILNLGRRNLIINGGMQVPRRLQVQLHLVLVVTTH